MKQNLITLTNIVAGVILGASIQNYLDFNDKSPLIVTAICLISLSLINFTKNK